MKNCLTLFLFLAPMAVGCGDTIHHAYDAPTENENTAARDSQLGDCRYQRNSCAQDHDCILVDERYTCVATWVLERSSSQSESRSTHDNAAQPSNPSQDAPPRTETTTTDLGPSGETETNHRDDSVQEQARPSNPDHESDVSESELTSVTDEQDGETNHSDSASHGDGDAESNTRRDSARTASEGRRAALDPGRNDKHTTAPAPLLPITPGRPMTNFSYRYGVDERGDVLNDFSFEQFQIDDNRWGQYNYMVIMLSAGFCPACESWLEHIAEYEEELSSRDILFASILIYNSQNELASGRESYEFSQRYAEFEPCLSLGERDATHEHLWMDRFGEQGIQAFPTFLVIRRSDGVVLNMERFFNSFEDILASVDDRPVAFGNDR